MKYKRYGFFLLIFTIITVLGVFFVGKFQINEDQKDTFYNTVQQQAIPQIDQLTGEKHVVTYIKKYKRLPTYYITKTQAKKKGWSPLKGNLCDVLPGKAIGGDPFANRERKLPTGEQYFEADVNYTCGRRTSHRVIFNKHGEVWLTHDHYKTFKKQ